MLLSVCSVQGASGQGPLESHWRQATEEAEEAGVRRPWQMAGATDPRWGGAQIARPRRRPLLPQLVGPGPQSMPTFGMRLPLICSVTCQSSLGTPRGVACFPQS
jgi:hypothetical protein